MLKNKILLFSHEELPDQAEDQQSVKDLILEIIDFNRNYKRKPKKFRKLCSSYDHVQVEEDG